MSFGNETSSVFNSNELPKQMLLITEEVILIKTVLFSFELLCGYQ